MFNFETGGGIIVMKYDNYFKVTSRVFTLSVSVFLLSIALYFYLQSQYIQKNEKNYIEAIDQEIQLLITLKKTNTFDIAKRISYDKNLIAIMKNKEWDKLYDDNVFKIAKEFKHFNNLALHIVDENGNNRYLSWTKKSIGKNILHVRKDLQKLYKDPKPMSNISVGKFDITFKGTVPIYDEERNFLGIIEVVTHFNSISQHLLKDQIYTALVIDKRFTEQLKFPFSQHFIEGYNISTLTLYPDVAKLLESKGVKYFINKPEGYEEGYYTTEVNILGIDKSVIGHYLIFIADKYSLHQKVFFLRVITIIATLLFLMMAYLALLSQRKNRKLIGSLHQQVIKETEKNLTLVYNDELTKCYKKEKFLADKDIYSSSELVMLNIKNFSQVNATYGFLIGDEVLKLTAEKLHTILEQIPYRIDSDEFVFVSDDPQHDIQKIQSYFKDSSIHITHDDINLRISFSFSVVHGGQNDLLRKLTIALKQAKQEPFMPYVYYKEENVNNDFIKFNSYLYDAIFAQQNARIVPYFQGIRNNTTGKIIKYESLARLEVSQKIYTPFFFIDIAKNSGFLFEITKIMIDKSFAFLAQQDKEISISINITEDDLLSKKLKKCLLLKLKEYNLVANRIVLEILEGVSASGTNSSIIQLKELKEAGFLLAIDDFGVEYSNFERINELDVDFIKIDGKYIKALAKNKKSYQITKAIADFANTMDIEVIAEFVENEAIQLVVEEIGINYSQGYYFSQPNPKML